MSVHNTHNVRPQMTGMNHPLKAGTGKQLTSHHIVDICYPFGDTNAVQSMLRTWETLSTNNK